MLNAVRCRKIQVVCVKAMRNSYAWAAQKKGDLNLARRERDAVPRFAPGYLRHPPGPLLH
jgi:hypothetical protein